jgi:hypothetical protein
MHLPREPYQWQALGLTRMLLGAGWQGCTALLLFRISCRVSEYRFLGLTFWVSDSVGLVNLCF